MTTAAPATTRPAPPRPGPPRTDGRATAARGRGRWVRFEKWWWDGSLPGGGIRGALSHGGAWPREAVMLLLRLSADRAIWEGAPFPSRRRIAAQVGWTDGRVRTLLRHEGEWLDPEQVEGWHAVRPRHRSAPEDKPPEANTGAPGEGEKVGTGKKQTGIRTARPTADVLRRYRSHRKTYQLQAWTPAELHELTEAVVAEILQSPATPLQAAGYAACVCRLLGLYVGGAEPPDLAAFLDDVAVVARAARTCPHPVFRRYIRGDGLPDSHDRSADIPYLTKIEAWPERLQLARSWSTRVEQFRARSALAEAADVASASGDAATAETPPSKVWLDVCHRLEGGGQWCAMAELADVQLADHPADHARRRQALRYALETELPEGHPNMTDAEWLRLHLPRFRDLFDLFYGAEPDPPDIPAP